MGHWREIGYPVHRKLSPIEERAVSDFQNTFHRFKNHTKPLKSFTNTARKCSNTELFLVRIFL